MKREPLLSDDEIGWGPNGELAPFGDGAHWVNGVHYARNFYEAKIASGELLVVKKSVMDSSGNLQCEDTSCMFMGMAYGYNFCPDCSGKIVKE